VAGAGLRLKVTCMGEQALEFKIATEPWEFEEIHRLNYETFAEEIPQHHADGSRRLVDKFHAENTYVIAVTEGRVVGMVAFRAKRPFSLDAKLANLDSYLPPGRTVCEVRLLAVEKGYRTGRVLQGLLNVLVHTCRALGHDLAIISGAMRQQRLYRHLGFVPFGPQVGTPEAPYQPMYLTVETWDSKPEALARAIEDPAVREGQALLLPGPVGVSPTVRRAYAAAPVSHRGERFVSDVAHTQRLLCSLTGARYVQIMVGSGTLANDVIAAQLSLADAKGLVLVNGEFGERLVDHARRFGLSFDVHAAEWGQAFERAAIEAALDRAGKVDWLWGTHCETSTGVLNDLAAWKDVCERRGTKLCADCISSLGTVQLDLAGVHLASGVSGKGLGALPGLALVFHNHAVRPAEPPGRALPRYLDLGLYAANHGVPFTHSSNLLYALQSAVSQAVQERPYERIAALAAWLRPELRRMGFRIIAADEHASPAVISLALPPGLRSLDVGEQLERDGFLLSYRSGYLAKRNWIQVGLMGEVSRGQLERLLGLLRAACPLS